MKELPQGSHTKDRNYGRRKIVRNLRKTYDGKMTSSNNVENRLQTVLALTPLPILSHAFCLDIWLHYPGGRKASGSERRKNGRYCHRFNNKTGYVFLSIFPSNHFRKVKNYFSYARTVTVKSRTISVTWQPSVQELFKSTQQSSSSTLHQQIKSPRNNSDVESRVSDSESCLRNSDKSEH